MESVNRAKDYIAAGDIFQVVLSQRWDFEPGVAPLDLYRALRTVNPSPYMFFLRFGGGRIGGAKLGNKKKTGKRGSGAGAKNILGSVPEMLEAGNGSDLAYPSNSGMQPQC